MVMSRTGICESFSKLFQPHERRPSFSIWSRSLPATPDYFRWGLSDAYAPSQCYLKTGERLPAETAGMSIASRM